ncbi:MAG: 2'-5' RNA ligase family protein [Kineosporiaceae bacterium]
MTTTRTSSATAATAPPSSLDTLVLGVVVDLPEPAAGELRAHREAIGDPQVDLIPAHVTLLPPTAVAPEELRRIERHLATLATRSHPFEVSLDGAETFRPISQVVYVRVTDGAEHLDALQRTVRRGPLERDLVYPFHPHVTVAHKLDDAVLDVAMTRLARYRASFTVDSFLLYEQDSTGLWHPRRRFGFGRPERGGRTRSG